MTDGKRTAGARTKFADFGRRILFNAPPAKPIDWVQFFNEVYPPASPPPTEVRRPKCAALVTVSRALAGTDREPRR